MRRHRIHVWMTSEHLADFCYPFNGTIRKGKKKTRSIHIAKIPDYIESLRLNGYRLHFYVQNGYPSCCAVKDFV